VLFLGVWFAGGVLAFAGAMAYAELAALRPRAGGEYQYVRAAFGDLPGFVYVCMSILIGAASVAWWHHADDLRFYAWVQFMPLVTISLLVALYPGRYTHRRYLVYGLVCYLAAKVAEALDPQIYAASGELLSGHTLKHLLAALALYYVYVMLRRRMPVSAQMSAPAR